MEHRRNILMKLKNNLVQASENQPTVCVATQVIEAGVDVSFDCVIRLMAGMDSIVQAAGRCNRNREKKELAPVFIVNLVGENLNNLADIKRGKDATESLLYDYNADERKYSCDLTSNMSIGRYYENFYRQLNVGEMDYFVLKHDTSLLDMLSQNEKWGRNDQYYHHQAFREAGKCFEVFDSETTDVLVPYEKGEKIIEELNACSIYDTYKKAELIRMAKQYTVSIYSWQRKKLEEEGRLHWCMENTIAYITSENYDEATGLVSKENKLKFMEV